MAPPPALPRSTRRGRLALRSCSPAWTASTSSPFISAKSPSPQQPWKKQVSVSYSIISTEKYKTCETKILQNMFSHHSFNCCSSFSGLVDNPELRVVLIFVYEAYKSGGARFLSQILEPLAKSKALIAGGLVESVFSPTRHWWVNVLLNSHKWFRVNSWSSNNVGLISIYHINGAFARFGLNWSLMMINFFLQDSHSPSPPHSVAVARVHTEWWAWPWAALRCRGHLCSWTKTSATQRQLRPRSGG